MWNAALGCWMISSMINGRSVQHHYYPSTGSYTNSSGQSVSRPAHAPAVAPKTTTMSPSRTNATPARSNTTTPAKSAGFGSTGRGGSSPAA